MTSKQPLRLILDTDPGIDDALALLLALASPEVSLEGVTTVSGNVPLEDTTRNALALLALAGRDDIPVAAGAARPLVREPIHAAEVHGQRGLGRAELTEPTSAPVSQPAAVFLCERIKAAPGAITLVAVGPLTNLALAVRLVPEIAQQVREVVIMGGALRVPGNITPAAEFNIYADPEAAHVVFHAGWPLRLVSLDTTQQVGLTRTQFAPLCRPESRIGRCIDAMLAHYFEDFAPRAAYERFHLHDPLALAAAFHPELLEWESVYIDVELSGHQTPGATVAWFRRRPETPPANVLAATAVDVTGFTTFFLERLARLL
ncbi:MAG: nucleoside hydrolase [Thermogemmatispora sp.]|uniref:nucleoside hydrolase n=1 Tax=Thermogemmatispora sp. TaxID=1968838 RepID=UPI00262D592B|nr:nucleoside hydrolase [Thermogemmatispora sp.]MBX5457248.1 nucleoside hydrolase [Thermogemmatispora sp.]